MPKTKSKTDTIKVAITRPKKATTVEASDYVARAIRSLVEAGQFGVHQGTMRPDVFARLRQLGFPFEFFSDPTLGRGDKTCWVRLDSSEGATVTIIADLPVESNAMCCKRLLLKKLLRSGGGMTAKALKRKSRNVASARDVLDAVNSLLLEGAIRLVSETNVRGNKYIIA